MHMRILVIGGLAQSQVNFRGPLLQAMVSAGHFVAACANGRDLVTEQKLQQMGIAYYPIRLVRAGMNPINDIKTLVDMIRVISRLKPDILLSYTIKPVIYGGLAAQLCGVKACYPMITGLGYSFMESRSLLQRFSGVLTQMLYRLSLKRSRKVFFFRIQMIGRCSWKRVLFTPTRRSLLTDLGSISTISQRLHYRTSRFS